MTGVDRQMWICGNCGETNDGEPGVCETCGRPSRSTEPTRWDAIPPIPQRLTRPAGQQPPGNQPAGNQPAGNQPADRRAVAKQPIENREPVERRERWEPRNAPGFRGGPPPAPRNAPPAVAGTPWPPPVKQPADAAWNPEPAGATWIPEPADPPPDPDEPAIRRRLLPAVPIVVLIAALAAAAILGGPRLFDSASTEPRNRPAGQRLGDAPPPNREQIPIIPDSERPLERATTEPPGSEEPGGEEPGTEPPGRTGLVTVDPEVTHDRADAVAAMLETYFTGINAKDYAGVAEVLDPDGELDPDDPEQMARFSDGTATARDSDVVLHDLTDLGAGRLGADVSFRSRQEAGDGPEDRPDETCTDWRVSYTITIKPKYRILRAEGTSNPC
ncbi:hypothetical protein [Actinoplanes sp. NPDC023714]|uniref:hypothetical protein n=1 Tax=Actinoplanes sp. NPDC023714 TaxID=3154322 RepID=UPI0033D74B34